MPNIPAHWLENDVIGIDPIDLPCGIVFDPMTGCISVDGINWEQPDLLALLRAAAAMREAILKTLDENGHLADGDNCTLRHLVQVIETPNV